jgi:hypothetical protein
MATEAGDFPPPLEPQGVLPSQSDLQGSKKTDKGNESQEVNNTHCMQEELQNRKRRREEWQKSKEEQQRFDLHRALGNVLRRAEDLFAEVCMIFFM